MSRWITKTEMRTALEQVVDVLKKAAEFHLLQRQIEVLRQAVLLKNSYEQSNKTRKPSVDTTEGR